MGYVEKSRQKSIKKKYLKNRRFRDTLSGIPPAAQAARSNIKSQNFTKTFLFMHTCVS